MSNPVAFQCSFSKNGNYSQIYLWLPVTAGFYLSPVAQSLCADRKKYKEICDLWFACAAVTRVAVIADGRVKCGRLIYDFCVELFMKEEQCGASVPFSESVTQMV